jgi:hypothetical protein
VKLTRKHRILTALVALFGVLFMQLAVASYICPGLRGGNDLHAMAAEESPMQSMPGCDQPDSTNPALCQAHCQDGKSSLDKPNAPVISPAAVIVSAILTPLEPLVSRPLRDAEPDSLLLRITSPPISIRHCCLRI